MSVYRTIGPLVVGCNTRCIPFSVICFLSQSGMNADGYRRGYVSFAHFCYILCGAWSGNTVYVHFTVQINHTLHYENLPMQYTDIFKL